MDTPEISRVFAGSSHVESAIYRVRSEKTVADAATNAVGLSTKRTQFDTLSTQNLINHIKLTQSNVR